MLFYLQQHGEVASTTLSLSNPWGGGQPLSKRWAKPWTNYQHIASTNLSILTPQANLRSQICLPGEHTNSTQKSPWKKARRDHAKTEKKAPKLHFLFEFNLLMINISNSFLPFTLLIPIEGTWRSGLSLTLHYWKTTSEHRL